LPFALFVLRESLIIPPDRIERDLLSDSRELDQTSQTAPERQADQPLNRRSSNGLFISCRTSTAGPTMTNLTASAGPIINAAETTSPPICSKSVLTSEPRQITGFPSKLLGPGSSCSRVKVCTPEQTDEAIGVCCAVEGREHTCGHTAGGSATSRRLLKAGVRIRSSLTLLAN
jgi:hypothetical protein